MDMYDTWVYDYANEYMKEFGDVFFEERNSSGSSSTVSSYPNPFDAAFVEYSPCKSIVIGKQELEEYQRLGSGADSTVGGCPCRMVSRTYYAAGGCC
jgi:hypothetical protein